MKNEVKWLELTKGNEVVLKFRDDSELKALVVFVNYKNKRFLTVDFEGSNYLKTVSSFEINSQGIKFYKI